MLPFVTGEGDAGSPLVVRHILITGMDGLLPRGPEFSPIAAH